VGVAVALAVNNLFFDRAMLSRATVTAQDGGKKEMRVQEKAASQRREQGVCFVHVRQISSTNVFICLLEVEFYFLAVSFPRPIRPWPVE